MGAALECLRDSLCRPAEHVRRLAAGSYRGSKREERGAAAASCVPPALCLALLGAFSPWLGDRAWAEQAAYATFVAATWPAAGGALWLLARAFGFRPSLSAVLEAWGATYWATSLFLATLWATHVVPLWFGLEPSRVPPVYASLALVAFLAAALWKALLVAIALRFGVGARGLRFVGMLVALAALGLAFALLSAILWGTKIPIA